MPKIYTVAQVADILGYSTNSIYTFLREKRIKGVRVGRGRFRIPEEELARILHLSKRTTTPTESIIGNPIVHKGDDVLVQERVEPAFRLKGLGTHIGFPNIFDWFVGVSAVTSGLGLLLFNKSFEKPGSVAFVAFLPAIITILILGGLGVILTCFFHRPRWHSVFLIILSVMGFANTRMFFVSRDFDAAVIYGALAVLVGIHAFVKTGGVVSLGLYLSALVVAAPVAMYVFPGDVQVMLLLQSLGISKEIAMILFGFVAIVQTSTFWIGYRMSQISLWIGSWIAAAVSFLLALFLFHTMYWSRGYFLVSVGFFAIVLPIWRAVQLNASRRQQILMHAVFVIVGLFIGCTVIAVKLLQINAWSQNKLEIVNKTVYAQSIVQTALKDIEHSLVAASQNSSFLQSFENEETGYINEFSKVLIESNTNLRRIVYLDEKGQGLLIYPSGTFDQKDLSFRDYFIHVRDRRTPFVSNSFQALVDNKHRYVVAVAVPLINEKDEFIGAMVGSMDLEGLGGQLQKVVLGSLGEYVLLSDTDGKRIIHPDPALIGNQLSEHELTLINSATEVPTVVQEALFNGSQGIISFVTIDQTPWILSVWAPLSRVYNLNFRSSLVLVLVVGAAIVTTLVIVMFLNARFRQFLLDGGS